MRVQSSLHREQAAIAEFEVANRRLQRAATKAQTLSGIMGPFGGVMNNSSTAIVAGVGGYMAVLGLATVGTVVAFVNYARQFMFPMMQIANLYNTIQSAIAGAERVFEILDEEPELPDIPNADPLAEIQATWSLMMSVSATSLTRRCSRTSASTPAPARPSLGRPHRRRQDHHRQPADAFL